MASLLSQISSLGTALDLYTKVYNDKNTMKFMQTVGKEGFSDYFSQIIRNIILKTFDQEVIEFINNPDNKKILLQQNLTIEKRKELYITKLGFHLFGIPKDQLAAFARDPQVMEIIKTVPKLIAEKLPNETDGLNLYIACVEIFVQNIMLIVELVNINTESVQLDRVPELINKITELLNLVYEYKSVVCPNSKKRNRDNNYNNNDNSNNNGGSNKKPKP